MRIAVMMQLPVETEKARPSHAHYCTPGAYGAAKKKEEGKTDHHRRRLRSRRTARSPIVRAQPVLR